jgi:hypothetical protein
VASERDEMAILQCGGFGGGFVLVELKADESLMVT